LRWGLSDKIDVVVPYGGIDRKPTNITINHHMERRREVGLTIGGSVSGGIVGLSVEGS